MPLLLLADLLLFAVARMRRKHLGGALVVVFLAVWVTLEFTGCGGGSSSPPPTGTPAGPPKAKTITRNTYALVNAAQGFADFGQHIDRTTVGIGVAFAAVSVCLELAAHLERELKGS